MILLNTNLKKYTIFKPVNKIKNSSVLKDDNMFKTEISISPQDNNDVNEEFFNFIKETAKKNRDVDPANSSTNSEIRHPTIIQPKSQKKNLAASLRKKKILNKQKVSPPKEIDEPKISAKSSGKKLESPQTTPVSMSPLKNVEEDPKFEEEYHHLKYFSIIPRGMMAKEIESSEYNSPKIYSHIIPEIGPPGHIYGGLPISHGSLMPVWPPMHHEAVPVHYVSPAGYAVDYKPPMMQPPQNHYPQYQYVHPRLYPPQVGNMGYNVNYPVYYMEDPYYKYK